MKNMSFALAVSLFAVMPCSADLIHHYTFDTDVSDSEGGTTGDGTLFGGAAIVDGVLVIPGGPSYVGFSRQIVPNVGSYTVAFFAREDVVGDGYAEMISQGISGGALPGFDFGRDPLGRIALHDSWGSTGIAFPDDERFHHFALTVDAVAGKSKLYVDGVLKAALAAAIETTASGSNTRLGSGFAPSYGENFWGALDDLRIYDNALSDADVAAIAVIPGPAGFALIGIATLGSPARRRRGAD